jgi:hypothetical protein
MVVRSDFIPFKAFFMSSKKQYAAGLSRAYRKSNTSFDVAMYVLGRSKSERFSDVFVGRLYASGFGGCARKQYAAGL